MKMSDLIAGMILDMFENADDETIQIQRNDLANQIGCVPSQINYVITSRFTPEQGYTIESRRGGGGCIYITRADNKNAAIMSLINSIGNNIDEKSARAHINNLYHAKLIDEKSAKIVSAALGDNNFRETPKDERDKIRAMQFKRMLIACSE